MFEIDLANDSISGPFFQWSANGTKDRVISAATFYIRDGGDKTPVDAEKGLVLDLATLKTGWCRSDGVAGVPPEWKWNPSPSQMMASPGEGWKKGISIRVAISKDRAATWEQSGAAVWDALVHLVPQIQESKGPNEVPHVKLTRVDDKVYAKGGTAVPILDVAKWIDRPACLKDGATIATAPAAAPTLPPAVATAPAAVPPGEGDDLF
jgi:hypothetical protein